MSITLKQIDKVYTVNITTGKTTLGRGPLLKCADKKVSRNHAELEVLSDGRVFLTSLHVNPCFHGSSGETPDQAVAQNTKRELQHGDVFSLLPGSFIYEIAISNLPDPHRNENKNSDTEDEKDATVNDVLETTVSVEQCSPQKNTTEVNAMPSTSKETSVLQSKPTNRKRVLPSWLVELAAGGDDNSTKLKKQPASAKGSKATGSTSKTDKPGKHSVENKNDNSAGDDEKPEINSVESVEQNVKYDTPHVTQSERKPSTDENGTNPTGATASSNATTKKRRSKCAYADKCYRKNPTHFEEFSHPNDSDYDEGKSEDECDENNDRPECEYGTKCYRKNPQHKKDYKHTKLPARAAAKKANARRKEMEGDEDGEYESDFIDDSDEYNPQSSTDEESDENVDELVSDAKKIIRSKH